MLGLSNHSNIAAANSLRWTPGFDPAPPRFSGNDKGDGIKKPGTPDSPGSLDEIDLDSDYCKSDADSIRQPSSGSGKSPIESRRKEPKELQESKDTLEIKGKPHKNAKVESYARDAAHVAVKKSKPASKPTEGQSSDEEEPVPVDMPPKDQYSRYQSEQRLIKQLEWGRKFESAGKALDWMEENVKWASRRAAHMAQDWSGSASDTAGQAMKGLRKTAASQLKRLATALEGQEPDAVESSADHPPTHRKPEASSFI